MNMIPDNNELVREIETLLGEKIPDNAIDKMELHGRLEQVIIKAFAYNDNFICPVINDAKHKLEFTGIGDKVEVLFNPDIQVAIEKAMKRCIEIYHSFNCDRL